jgi:hypothetical protein
MTQARLECSVSDHTGELPRTLHRRGSGLQARRPRHPDHDDVRLDVDRPSCGRPVPASNVSPALAECSDLRCDFDFAIGCIHVGRP